jgi:hypothetical protein
LFGSHKTIFQKAFASKNLPKATNFIHNVEPDNPTNTLRRRYPSCRYQKPPKLLPGLHSHEPNPSRVHCESSVKQRHVTNLPAQPTCVTMNLSTSCASTKPKTNLQSSLVPFQHKLLLTAKTSLMAALEIHSTLYAQLPFASAMQALL